MAANFIGTIEDIAHGKLIERLNEDLAELVEAVAETCKKGEVVLKLTVKFEGGMAMVDAEVKTKSPRHNIPPSLFYFGEKGGDMLSRNNPRQLKLKDVSKPPIPLRSVDDSPPPAERSPKPSAPKPSNNGENGAG